MQKTYKVFLIAIISLMVLLLSFSFLPTDVSAEEIVTGYTDTRSFAKSNVALKSYINDLKSAETTGESITDKDGADTINDGLWFPILAKNSLTEQEVATEDGGYEKATNEVITSPVDPDRLIQNISGHLANDIAPYNGYASTDDVIWIVAPIDGVIYASHFDIEAFSGYTQSTYGNYVVIQSGDFYIRFAHLDGREGKWLNLEEGASITKGHVIGNMGNTGSSTGRHLHVEVYTEVEGIKRYYDPTQVFGYKTPIDQLDYYVKISDSRKIIKYSANGTYIKEWSY